MTLHPSISELPIIDDTSMKSSSPSCRSSQSTANCIKPDGWVSVRTLCLLGALLPGLGCYFCIGYTYTFQFERVMNFTSSHCPDVKSPFPPVSYSIGVWQPQKFFWLLILAFHIPPRLLFNVIYAAQFKLGHSESKNETWFRRMVWLHMRLLYVEVFGLLSVSVIDIDSHFLLHAMCYTLWLVTFNFNMLFNTILHHYSGYRQVHRHHDVSFQIKRIMFIVGAPVSVASGVSYITYTYLCNNIAYAMFSVAECIIVGLNSGFYFLVTFGMGAARVELNLTNIKHAMIDV